MKIKKAGSNEMALLPVYFVSLKFVSPQTAPIKTLS